MSKLILNDNYTEDKINNPTSIGKYLFISESGASTPAKLWFEKSKNKYHIMSQEMLSECNRQYVSEKLFKEKSINGEYEIEVRQAPPRKLCFGGKTGKVESVVKYLDDTDAKRFVELLDKASKYLRLYRTKDLTTLSQTELNILITLLSKYKDSQEKPKSALDMLEYDEFTEYQALLEKSQLAKTQSVSIKPVKVKISKPISRYEEAKRMLEALLSLSAVTNEES